MNSTAQLAIDPQLPLPTGPTHVAAHTSHTAGEWKATDRWAWSCGLPVSGIGRAVAGCIAYHANDRTGLSWPGIGTIVKETGFKRTSVIAAIHEIERGGHFRVTRLKVGKKNESNRYQLPPMGRAQQAPCEPDQQGGGSAPHALGSAPDGLGGSAPDGLGGSAPDGPESVSTESVSTESVKNSSSARVVCPICKHDWPAQYGTKCHRCTTEPSKAELRQKANKRAGEEWLARDYTKDGASGSLIRNCPKCHATERGHDDKCQSCDWTRDPMAASASAAPPPPPARSPLRIVATPDQAKTHIEAMREIVQKTKTASTMKRKGDA